MASLSRDIRQPVNHTVAEVMSVAADLTRLPEWAQGFAAGAEPDGDGWVIEAPFGRVRAVFDLDVEKGILDHDVTMPDGTVVHNRLRVEPRPHGSDIVFTVLRLPGMTEAQLEADAAAVAADLRRLAELCEKIDE